MYRFELGKSVSYVVVDDRNNVVRVYLCRTDNTTFKEQSIVTLTPRNWVSLINLTIDDYRLGGVVEKDDMNVIFSNHHITVGDRSSIVVLTGKEWMRLRESKNEIWRAIVDTLFGRLFRERVRRECLRVKRWETVEPTGMIESQLEDALVHEISVKTFEIILKAFVKDHGEGSNFFAECYHRLWLVYGERAIASLDMDRLVVDFVAKNKNMCPYITDKFLQSRNFNFLLMKVKALCQKDFPSCAL